MIAASAIMAALQKAFPQPERGILRQPGPEHRVGPRTFLTNYGCLIVIVFIVLLFVLAGIGLYSVVKYIHANHPIGAR
jgi:hypothetical protein